MIKPIKPVYEVHVIYEKPLGRRGYEVLDEIPMGKKQATTAMRRVLSHGFVFLTGEVIVGIPPTRIYSVHVRVVKKKETNDAKRY